jgi:MFS family permease
VPKIYYGWRMVAASAGLQFLISALLMQAFGVYVAVLSAEFGWSRTALAGGAAIQSLEGALIGPVLGWLIDRFGPRAVVRAGVIVFALGFLAFSTVDTIPGFYAAVTLIAIGGSMIGYFPLSVCLMHFFERRRAVNVHAISHMKQALGYSLAQASFIITLMTIAQGAGMLLGAAVGDRWSKRHIAALCMLAHMVGLMMLAYATHVSMLAVFAVLHGMAWGLRGPLMQALRADFFGVREIGMIMGLSAVVISIGQVVGPLVAGVVYDWTGHYQIGFLVLALLAGAGSVMFLRARPPA